MSKHFGLFGPFKLEDMPYKRIGNRSTKAVDYKFKCAQSLSILMKKKGIFIPSNSVFNIYHHIVPFLADN